jgi:hypothetical protein
VLWTVILPAISMDFKSKLHIKCVMTMEKSSADCGNKLYDCIKTSSVNLYELGTNNINIVAL